MNLPGEPEAERPGARHIARAVHPPGWAASLRLRLLAATLLGLALALLLAGFGLSGLFREHVMRQFQASLLQQLDQVTAQLAFDDLGTPQLASQALTDPRWHRPYSGLYWQIDAEVATRRVIDDVATRRVIDDAATRVWRSRSLWDAVLPLTADARGDGEVHAHEIRGPQDTPLLMLERTVFAAEHPQARWRLAVAADSKPVNDAVADFRGVLAASLTVLMALLALAALAQVGVGLQPLRRLQRALTDLHGGRTRRIEGRFPSEVQPLIDDFNAVLDRQDQSVARARTQAGNLAHAVKTPLAVMAQAAAQAQTQAVLRAGLSGDAPTPGGDVATLAQLVREQAALAHRQVDWHLSLSRAAAAHHAPGLRAPVDAVLQGLVRTMRRIHAERSLHIDCPPVAAAWAFAGEEQDLQQMLGNLLDNACQWARSTVRVQVRQHPQAGAAALRLHVRIEDDGPGIAPGSRSAVMARGARIDESTPGSGLGLAIVADLVESYGGRVELGDAELGGLRVDLELPAAA